MSKSARVLFIEDDEVERRAFLRMVRDKSLPWEVKTAGTLAAARARLTESHFDVIVADNHLPDGESTELFDEIANIPFVLVTGTLKEQLALRTLERGADDYLVKDVEHRHLEALPMAVEKTLYRKAIHERERRLTRELRDSERRLRATFENAASGIIETDQEDRLVAVNDRFCRMLGYTREQLLGMNVHELTYPADRPRSDELNTQLLAGRLPMFQHEKRYLKRDGSPLWVQVGVSAVHDEAGRYLYSVGTVVDVSARRRAEAQVRLQAAALEAAPNAISLSETDPHGTIVWVNSAFTKLTGYSAEETIGHSHHILSSGRQDEPFYRNLWQTIERGEMWRGELVNRHKDGTLYYEEMGITPLRDEEGKITHYVAIKQDISARKQAELALRENERQLRFVCESIPHLVWAARPDGYIDYLNQRVLDYTGAKHEELVGWGWLPFIHPEDRQATLEHWKSALRDGSEVRLSYRLRHGQSGEYRWHAVHALPLRDDAGRIIRWYGTCTDIDEQKRAEERLEQRVSQRTADLAQALAEAEQGRATLDALLESIPEGVTIGDVADYKLVRASRYMAEMLGVDVKALEGITVYEYAKRWETFEADGLTPLHPEGFPIMEAMREGRTVRERELVMRRGTDGAKVPILCNAAPIRASSGQITGGVGAWRDITEQKRAEAAVRESEERLRFALEACHIGAWDLDLVDHSAYRSAEHDRIFGYAEPLPRWTLDDFLRHALPEDRAEVEAMVRQATAARTGWTSECRIRRADGEIRWIWFTGRHRTALSGHSRVVGVVQDITERKRAEAALRESEGNLHNFLNTAATGLVRNSRDLRYLSVNTAYADLAGRPADQIIGHSLAEVLGEEALEKVCPYIRRVLRGERVEYEIELPFAGSGPRWIHAIYAPDRDAAGAVIGWVGSITDITKRKHAEVAVRESEQRLKLAQQAARIGVFEWNVQTDVNVWTPELEAMYGLASGEFGKTEAAWEQRVHPEDRAAVLERVQQAFETGEPAEKEWRVIWPDGSVHWIMGRFQVLKDAADKPLRLSGVNIDITERKRAEATLRELNETLEQRVAERTEALRVAKAEAEKANAAKDHFLAVLSHELRTPLTPVVTALAMLQQTWHCDKASQETLEMIGRNVELEARLIDDLLDMTRIAKGKVELAKKPVMLCEVIRRAVEVCKPDIEARRLHFGVDLGPDAPYLVHADVGRLQQVFWNLLKNAIKFTPHGGCVGIRCRPDDHTVIAEVTDSGVGIESADLGRIFNAFEQVEHSTSRQFGGLGLGLAIARAIVELHGGAIEGHSRGRNKGATFRVRLPILAGAHLATTGGEQAAVPVSPPAPALRILLVEDHGDTARVLQRLLVMDGHKVTVAGDVATALEEASNPPFDLLLSDLGLPDGSGIDLMRELRARGYTMPGIALSGYGQEEDIRRSKDAGFAAHLTKPTSPERLTEAIAAIAGSTATPRPH